MTVEDLQHARMRFAKEIQQQGHIKSTRLIEGLATVPRENFVGPGPWKIMRAAEMASGYQLTPDSDPRHLYDNVLVALDERRMLNNGEPLGLLLFLDSLTLSAGDRFLHIGSGVGYYTAIAAHAVGPGGTVVAVEIDAALAARAELNLRSYGTVSVTPHNGTLAHFGTFDAIFVNAGCTRAHSLWLDQLAVGGRLLIPFTVGLPTMPGIGFGSILLVTRGETDYNARFTSPVGIFHCEGARSAKEEALLAKAFARGDRGWGTLRPITQSIRGSNLSGITEEILLQRRRCANHLRNGWNGSCDRPGVPAWWWRHACATHRLVLEPEAVCRHLEILPSNSGFWGRLPWARERRPRVRSW